MALIERVTKRVIKFKTGGNKEVGIDTLKCDICGEIFKQKICLTERRRLNKISDGKDLCKNCTKALSINNLVVHGTKALANISSQQRKINASLAGKKSAEKYDPITNKSRFSTERWNAKTKEEQHSQVNRASQALQQKLEDPIYRAKHYAKIFKQSKIGYQSKAHKDLHSLISHLGFESHVQINKIQVDECNEKLKIVVEYNGDMWHCNPKTWKSTDYNRIIKMTAGEKWQKDIIRYKMLEKNGYRVIVVWETGWCENPQKYIKRIEEVCNEVSKQNRNSK